jgi:hypothetical protein
VLCGSFFEVWGMPFPKSGKTAIVPEDEDKSDGRVNEDLRIGKVCIV